MKRKAFILLMAAVLLLSCTALAEQVTIAPEVVPGHIMAYVINEAGAEVYQDVFAEGASLAPVETIEYGTEIEIHTLGLGYCRIRRDTKDVLYVRTKDLSFSNEAFEDQLAIVFLKRSKNMPLHKSANTSSKTLTKIPDGSYVVVLEKGETFSRVLYKKYDGYLQNAYLSFRSSWEGDLVQGKLRDPNKPTRKTTVNLRSADSLNGRKVATPHTLQQVIVLQFKGEWAEIETDKGIHGYVKADWIETIEPKPAEPAEPKEEAAPAEPAEAKPATEPEAVAAPEEVVAEETEDEAPEAVALAPEWEEDDSE